MTLVHTKLVVSGENSSPEGKSKDQGDRVKPLWGVALEQCWQQILEVPWERHSTALVLVGGRNKLKGLGKTRRSQSNCSFTLFLA